MLTPAEVARSSMDALLMLMVVPVQGLQDIHVE
jgi:hypothetical protein